MLILSFDVSVTGCAVGLLNTNTDDFKQERLETDRGQAEILIPMIADIVKASQTLMKDIDAIAVTRGPGSFTGVRIGLATARSLGLALNIPVYGFSTLDVLAKFDGSKSLYLIDTKRGDFYGQVGIGSTPQIWDKEKIADYQGMIIKDDLPDILTLSKMAEEIYAGEQEYDIAKAPSPLYLREAEVSVAKRKPQMTIDSL